MDERPHVGLVNLPRFTIVSVDVKGADAILMGVFDHLQATKLGRAWLYRPDQGSLDGDLTSIDPETRAARIVVDSAGLPPECRPGASFPYFYGYFEARTVDMILDPSRRWVRVKYEPTDSIRIVADDGALYGELEAGGQIPAGFRALARIPKGWSKEICEICQEEIGPAGQPFGYRDPRDVAAGYNSRGPWLCERDYEQFASRHDLGFLLT
jgi:hypothetical protein